MIDADIRLDDKICENLYKNKSNNDEDDDDNNSKLISSLSQQLNINVPNESAPILVLDIKNENECENSLFENKNNEKDENEFTNDNKEEDDSKLDNNIESDDHLPRVRIELDRLNYANESINNLELELEECKKEFLNTYYNSENQLIALEKKLGTCVSKSQPYYEARIELSEAKQKYLQAKIRFETAQELYVAAKNMQMYAEESLENFETKQNRTINSCEENDSNINLKRFNHEKEALVKILETAKIKVNETELSKQSNDLEQIESRRIYDEKLKQCEQFEKNIKRQIEKSQKYFELKANLNKELKFLCSKVEGLKSCLKEVKLSYQKSLKNLEFISYQVHAQRKLNSSTSDGTNQTDDRLLPPPQQQQQQQQANKLGASLKSLSPESSSSTLSSSLSSISSPNLSKNFDKNNETNLQSTNNLNNKNSNLTESSVNSTFNDEDEENIDTEDFDKYFTEALANTQLKTNDLLTKNYGKTIQYCKNLEKHGVCFLNDEDIENLKLSESIKKFESELTNRKRTEECCVQIQNKQTKTSSSSSKSSTSSLNNRSESTSTNTTNRPQFRVPALISQSGFLKK